MSAWSDVIQ
ncbi:hypothetical protein Taro_044680 [Colocasia esculenta]|uniref:Uncharacterized protein n=1 Tax=Colocasia esculenta TaxID=4460 RepID=A0A843X5Q5_COLES|nr:hypothetical protein [Colocasia esculenta]